MENKPYRVETTLPLQFFTCPMDALTDQWLSWQPADEGPGVFYFDANLALGVRAQLIDDDDLKRLVQELAPIVELRYLYLAENRNITNRGVRFLFDLPQLRYLNISSCDVNSEGLAFLPALTALETLDISYCNRISSAGGKYIQMLPKLKTLLVQGTTKLNTADLKKLEKRGLEIRTGK